MTRRSRYRRICKSCGPIPPISLWEKNPYRLSPAPETASATVPRIVRAGAGLGREGLWSSAASAFELLAAGSVPGVVADRNRGLVLLVAGGS